jgi:hypothetical protein
MAISQTQYVDITSGVAGNSAVPEPELILNIFTQNPLVPTGGAPLTFSNVASVGSYFGTSSNEYVMAQSYFGFVSKTFQHPDLLSYTYANITATFPLIFGANLVTIGTTLTALQAITSGGFALTMGATTNQVVGLDFAGLTLTQIASAIQTEIRTFTGTAWTAATVTYNSTAGAFQFTGGDDTAAYAINVAAPSSGTDISALIGWLPTTGSYPAVPVLSNGVLAAASMAAIMNQAVGISNNFGSFNFTLCSLDQAQIVALATWNAGQNFEYMFLVPVTSSNAAAISAALNSIGGTALTLSPVTSPQQYPELIPGMLLAATNYEQVNGTLNYMFQQVTGITPSVLNDTDYGTYNGLSVNFYGQTQNAGTQINFYQAGFLTGVGVNTNATDMNTYANEMWFKNAAGAELMSLLLAQNKISANPAGTAQVLSVLQGVINRALFNGTISVGNNLTNVQISTITSLSGDANAWRQVQNTGYWVGATVQPYTAPPNPATLYKIVYNLIYKKDDIIRMITGTDALI